MAKINQFVTLVSISVKDKSIFLSQFNDICFFLYVSSGACLTEQDLNMIAQKMITISRRHALHLLGAAATITAAPQFGFATADAVARRLAEVTNGVSIGDLEIFLDMPEIAENGNAVTTLI